MKIRIHEIEFGSNDTGISHGFYKDILGLDPIVEEENLKVFNAGITGLDFNLSAHYPSQVISISFITDNLKEIMNRLVEKGIHYEGPSHSHLGLKCIQFKDPDGYVVKVNSPTHTSPEWLKV